MATLSEGVSNEIVDELDALVTRLKTATDTLVVEGTPGPRTWAQHAYKTRRARDAIFGAELFGEGAWDVLLDLYAAHLDGKRVTVSSACLASAVPPTTALRYLDVLLKQGLIFRARDLDDGRRVYVAITDKAKERMERLYRKFIGTICRTP